jgi:hypothetical protein
MPQSLESGEGMAMRTLSSHVRSGRDPRCAALRAVAEPAGLARVDAITCGLVHQTSNADVVLY